MIETFIALSFAHVLADYVFQPTWMVKGKRNPATFIAHIAMVLALSMAAIGRVDAPVILALATAHLVIDAVKTYFAPDTLFAHLADQTVHFATIAIVALVAPTLWVSGLWHSTGSILPHAMLLIGGLVFATRAGGFAIGKLIDSHTAPDTIKSGLPKGGQTIGLLERGLIFALMLAGQATSIGFLIAAKSILRFGAVSEDRDASEYVIIGTLASFGWAIMVSLAVIKLQSYLPTLEIAPLLP